MRNRKVDKNPLEKHPQCTTIILLHGTLSSFVLFRSGSHTMYAQFRLYLFGTGLVVGLYFYKTSYKPIVLKKKVVEAVT